MIGKLKETDRFQMGRQGKIILGDSRMGSRYLVKGVSHDSGNLCIFSDIVLDRRYHRFDCWGGSGSTLNSVMG
jgi:hypothetical protein